MELLKIFRDFKLCRSELALHGRQTRQTLASVESCKTAPEKHALLHLCCATQLHRYAEIVLQ